MTAHLTFSEGAALGLRALLIVMLVIMLAACETPCADADLAYYRAKNAMLQGRYEWARDYFAKDLQQNPDRLESLKSLGIAWQDGRQAVLTQAIQYFDEYLTRAPDDVDIRLRLVRALMDAGDWQRLQRSDLLLGDSLAERLVEAEMLLELDADKALASISEILALHPDNVIAHEVAATIYQQQGETEKTLFHAKRASELGSLKAGTYYLLAQAASRLQQPELAKSSLEQREQIVVLSRRSRDASITPRQLSSALRMLENDLPGLAGSVNFADFKVRVLFELKDNDDAIAAFRQAASRFQFDPSQRLGMARAALRAGAEQLASELYQSLTDEASHEEAAELGLAQVVFRERDFETLRQQANEALGKNCWIAQHHYFLAQADIRDGEDLSAKDHLDQAVQLAPWRTDWRLLLANLYLTLGETRLAAQVLDRAPAADSAIDQFRREHGLM